MDRLKNHAVIFDLDGTLMDTLDDLTDSVNYVLKTYDFCEISRTQAREYIGNGARDFLRRSLPTSVGEEDLEKYLVEYKMCCGKIKYE